VSIVSTIPEKCRRCYACVRECPVKAIKVIAGQAAVIAEQCIACGSCVKVCTQKAKRIEDATVLVGRMLESGPPTLACIAPSFLVAFPEVSPGQIASALRRLGFAEVWEVAAGAELISAEYARLSRDAVHGDGSPVVSTPCPAIVSYVRKYLPALRGSLAPIVSPMIAVARAMRRKRGAGVRIVFIGPCIAKKAEIKDPFVQGTVDAVLTYEELLVMFTAAGVDPSVEPNGTFDGPPSFLGRSIPISGGLLRAAGIDADILQNGVMVTEGRDRVIPALRELAEGRSRARVLDVLFCEGCINGPAMTNALGPFARKEMLADHVNDRGRAAGTQDIEEALAPLRSLDLRREFSEQAVVLPRPTDEDIEAALHRMRKFVPADHLNCGSCGYATCRDKAVAVCQGFAEVGMCLPYLVEELEVTLSSLQKSHQATQDRLVQTEKLASMGQISAGVAHEINNPLSTILLYSHMLLKAHREGDPESEDIQMIVSEATRCRSIMRGLLDFARQARVVKTATDVAGLVSELTDSMRKGTDAARVLISCQVAPGLPRIRLDAGQVRQMLVNLVQNGVDAVEETGAPGTVSVCASLSDARDMLVLAVTDTGNGMAPEVQKEIFTPFYTTKQLGKGTGMGLSIVYGVVKMHAGDITVDSEPGRGTTFTVRIPAGAPGGNEQGAPAGDAPAARGGES
jgi:two-component system, NtrC family, sensor kinase